MTPLSSADVSFLLLGGKDVLGFSTRLNYTQEELVGRRDVLGDDWEYEELLGIVRTNVSHAGYYDHGAAGSNALIRDRGRTRMGGALGLVASTQGAEFLAWSGQLANQFQVETTREDWVKASAQMNAAGLGGLFKTMSTWATRTGAYTSSNLDNAASSANGAHLAIQVAEYTANGATLLTITFEHSANGSAWTTLGTATLSADGDAYIVVSGTVEQYVRVKHAWTDGTNPTAKTVAGIYRL